jgi:hypothetical protein
MAPTGRGTLPYLDVPLKRAKDCLLNRHADEAV